MTQVKPALLGQTDRLLTQCAVPAEVIEGWRTRENENKNSYVVLIPR